MARRRPSDAGEAVATAVRIADEVLFPSALHTEAAGVVPDAHLALLAEAGLYGLAGPTSAGGLALDATAAGAVIEALAGGCLATTFVWVQHHSLVRAMADDAPPSLRDEWLEPLCRGERRGRTARYGPTAPWPSG